MLEIHTLLWGVVLLDCLMLLILVWCFWIIWCRYFWWRRVETIMFPGDLLLRWLQKLDDTHYKCIVLSQLCLRIYTVQHCLCKVAIRLNKCKRKYKFKQMLKKYANSTLLQSNRFWMTNILAIQVNGRLFFKLNFNFKL